MSFAINILALLLVLGLCWIAMVWLSGRHGHGTTDDEGPRDLLAGPPVAGSGTVASGPVRPGATRTGTEQCQVCEGVGASHERGRIIVCDACQGTGTVNA